MSSSEARTDSIVEISDRILQIARDDPSRVAMIHARHRPWGPRYDRYTYGELSRRAEALAIGLREIGITEGTKCSFMVPPCFDALVLGVALWRVGAITVGIEPHSHGMRRVAKCLAKVGPEVFFGTPEAHVARLAFGWGRKTVKMSVVVGPRRYPGRRTMHSLEERGRARASRILDGLEEPERAALDPADVAVVAFTTGSTGEPKPTVLKQRNLAAMMTTVIEHWGLGNDGDVIDMPTFPMFWIIGLSTGGTVVVPPMNFTVKGPGGADPAKLVRTIHDCGVRSMFASPALLTNLSHYANERGLKLGSLQRIVAGGAEVPGPLFAAVKQALPANGEMYSDYGATEALPTTEIDGTTVVGETWPRTEQGAGVCVGPPLPGVELRIVAIDDGAIPSWTAATVLPPGEIGEVVARGPNISEEYFDNPKADADNKIPAEDGGRPWHRLGDTGYLDEQGRLWVCGRRSHRVVTARGTVFPLCCEPVVNAHPSVKRSALVGVPEGGGTVAVLCVQPVEDAEDGAEVDADALTGELRELVDRYEPSRGVDRIVVVERIPVDRRHNAKIDRPKVAKELAGGRGRRG